MQNKNSQAKNSKCDSSVKFLHNVFGAPNVDICLNNFKVPIVSNLQYQQFTGYLNFSDKNLKFTVKVAGTDTILATKMVSTEEGQYYTVMVTVDVQDLSTVSLLVFEDDNSRLKCHTANVRFIHGSVGAPSVDVYVDSVKAFSNVSFGETGMPEYATLTLQNATVGSCSYFYKVSVNVANTDTVVVGPLPVNLQNRRIYTIVASGSLESGVTAVMMEDNIKC